MLYAKVFLTPVVTAQLHLSLSVLWILLYHLDFYDVQIPLAHKKFLLIFHIILGTNCNLKHLKLSCRKNIKSVWLCIILQMNFARDHHTTAAEEWQEEHRYLESQTFDYKCKISVVQEWDFYCNFDSWRRYVFQRSDNKLDKNLTINDNWCTWTPTKLRKKL